MAVDFEVVDGMSMPRATVLEVLSQGYGRLFTEEWFEWKHVLSPWGSSRCYVAVDADGPLGVVFGQPWHLRVGDTAVAASRLVDGATLPRSVRRGVFRAVVAAELEHWHVGSSPGVVIATATPQAQAAHVKNGAAALEPVSFVARPARWSRAALSSGLTVLDEWAASGERSNELASTAWVPDALRWRLDPRSGHRYEVSRLAQSDGPHGVVHRTVAGRVRTLVVTARWGDAAAACRTIAAVALRERALVVLEPMGAGARVPMPRLALRRSSSLLCVWDRSALGEATPFGRREGWALDGLDLEGVI